MDWAQLIPISILFIGLGTFYVTNTTKYFTIREYQEFKVSTQREFDQLRHQVEVLESTRPTTGELKALIEGRINGTK